MHLIYLIFIFFLNTNFATGEVFTALVDLSRSFLSSKQFGDELYILTEQIKYNTNNIKVLANKLISSAHEESCNEECVTDPLKEYVLVRETFSIWQDFNDFLNGSDIGSLLNIIKRTYEDLPEESDMFGAVDSLLRLQVTYRISTQKIANGILYPNVTSKALSARDCFEIGSRSSHQNYFYFVQWMNEAYNRFTKEDEDIEKVEIIDYLSYGYYKLGNYRQALAFTNEWLKIDTMNERALQNKDYFENTIEKSKNSNEFSKGDNEELTRIRGNGRQKEFDTYEALCRGESSAVNHNPYLLKCQYYVPHYYFTILPIKEEVVFYNPRIAIYHDILTDNEIEGIKELSIPRLNRATVQNSVTGKLEYVSYRISKSAWLRYDLSALTKRINKRITIMTGIDLQTAEELQVVNYGVGGHYEPHFDFARKQEVNSFEPEIGNRVATLIYYMSDVEAGGATVFTEIGARVLPKKGSAAFWWNLYPSGEGDLSTRHAACPVLSGSKWVMNKWFHERGQELIRPCCLNRFSKIYHSKCVLINSSMN